MQPLRQICLDTETTGLEVNEGHRLVEVAGVEMVGRRLTGHHFHEYVHPERDIDPGAEEVHGITLAFLEDKPRFAEIAQSFVDYVAGAELIIHNASFDVGFLNAELERAGFKPITHYCPVITDSLRVARDTYPGQRNSLDALCKRLGVDNSGRTLHGALLDAELLADVWLMMTRGQESLLADLGRPAHEEAASAAAPSGPILVLSATPEELAAHEEQLKEIDKASKGACVWTQLLAADAPAQP